VTSRCWLQRYNKRDGNSSVERIVRGYQYKTGQMSRVPTRTRPSHYEGLAGQSRYELMTPTRITRNYYAIHTGGSAELVADRRSTSSCVRRCQRTGKVAIANVRRADTAVAIWLCCARRRWSEMKHMRFPDEIRMPEDMGVEVPGAKERVGSPPREISWPDEAHRGEDRAWSRRRTAIPTGGTEKRINGRCVTRKPTR